MKNTIKLVSVLVVIILVSVTSLIVQHNKQSRSNVNVEVKEKSDQEKAEEFAEKMKPKIEEELREMDIHGFINSIIFKKGVTISPMGSIEVRGYINDEPEKYGFSASLQYRAKKIGSMSFDSDLSDRFIDWEEYKDEPEIKENYLKSFTKKEREQYLRDIGEKK